MAMTLGGNASLARTMVPKGCCWVHIKQRLPLFKGRPDD